MRNTRLLPVLMMSLSLLACTAWVASADSWGVALGGEEAGQDTAQVALHPERGGEVISGKGGGKPGGGGGGGGCGDNGGGVIYYRDPSDAWHALEADCGVDTTLSGLPRNVDNPSNQLHNGRRWFLSRVISTALIYPDGSRAAELWVFDETGASVPLTNYTQGDTTLGAVHLKASSMEWAPDDGFVSWTAVHWVDDDSDGVLDRIDDGGIYRASVTFDSSGDVAGLDDPTPASPVVATGLNNSGSSPAASGFAWSPDASRVVYHSSDTTELRRFDEVPESDPNAYTVIETGRDPEWSVNDVIVFIRGGEVRTVLPDGSGGRRVLRDRRNQLLLTHWSPTGSHIVFRQGDYPQDVVRVAATGDGKTAIAVGVAAGWVAAP